MKNALQGCEDSPETQHREDQQLNVCPDCLFVDIMQYTAKGSHKWLTALASDRIRSVINMRL